MEKRNLMPQKGTTKKTLDRSKIEKIIRITGIYLAVSHLLLPITEVLLSIVTNSLRELEYKVAIALMVEIVFLLGYMRVKYDNPREEIEALIKKYFTKDQIVLSLLPIVYFVSIVVNTLLDGQVRYTVNSKYLFDLLLNVFVTYPLGRYYVHQKFPKALEIFFHIVISVITVYMIYVLYMVFNGETFRTFYNGKIGMNRLEFGGVPEYHLQINSHHNTTGAFAGAFMLICIIMSVLKKGILRIVYILEAFVHSIVLVLTNSRSTFISGAVYLALYLGLILYFVLKHKSKEPQRTTGKLVRWFVALVAILGSFYVMCSLRDSVFDVYRKCTNDYIVSEERIYAQENEQSETVEARNLNVSNLMSRDLIWSYALQGMIMNNRNLFVGVTPPGIATTIGNIGGPEFYVYSHNQLLEIGLGLGIPGLLVFSIWLIVLANRCVIIGFAEETKASLQQKLVPLLVLYLVMFNMVEAILFFNNSFIGGLFMFASAWCFEAVRSAKVNSKVFRIRTDMLKNLSSRKKETNDSKCDIINKSGNSTEENSEITDISGVGE